MNTEQNIQAMQEAAQAQMKMQAASTKINGQLKAAESKHNTIKAAQKAGTEQVKVTAQSMSQNRPTQILR